MRALRLADKDVECICCNYIECSARLDRAAPSEAITLPTPTSEGDCLQGSLLTSCDHSLITTCILLRHSATLAGVAAARLKRIAADEWDDAARMKSC